MSSERKRVNIANCYQDGNRAKAYATLEFANTYYLAFRDLPGLIGITGQFLQIQRTKCRGILVETDMVR